MGVFIQFQRFLFTLSQRGNRKYSYRTAKEVILSPFVMTCLVDNCVKYFLLAN